jgi:hypothetical protein
MEELNVSELPDKGKESYNNVELELSNDQIATSNVTDLSKIECPLISLDEPRAKGKIYKIKEIEALSISLEPGTNGQICKNKEMVIYSIQQVS